MERIKIQSSTQPAATLKLGTMVVTTSVQCSKLLHHKPPGSQWSVSALNCFITDPLFVSDQWIWHDGGYYQRTVLSSDSSQTPGGQWSVDNVREV